MIRQTKQAITKETMMTGFTLLVVAAALLSLAAFSSQAVANPAPNKIFAQTLVEEMVAKHAELAGLELATTPPDGHDCVTIATTDPKEMGDKCDKGELSVMKTGKPTVEKESDGYDVTLPLHIGGKTVGIVAMDFKPDQQESGLVERAKVIAQEVEGQIPSKSKLFEAAK
jgi:hypothetical protein